MSNTRRPGTARQHTRTTDKNRDTELERGLRVTLEGEVYEIHIGDVTSTLARELRRGTGMSFQALMYALANDPDCDVIASFIWLAKRIDGERVEIEDVVVTYAQILENLEIEVPGARTEADDPEA